MTGILGFAAIFGLGAWVRPPRGVLWVLAVLWWVILVVANSPVAAVMPVPWSPSAGAFQAWLFIGVIGAFVALYRLGLGAVRRRAEPQTVRVAAATPAFSEAELDRYARHIVLREVGGPGQRRLKDAKVLVVGAGGLGSPALLYLAAAGTGTIGVIDDDTVSASNLQRQVIHADDRLGMPKVFSAEKAMKALNPFVTVRPYNRRLTAEIAEVLFSDYDLILDGSDNFATRYLVNAAAVAARRPLIAGAIAQWEGQVTLYDPARGAPCFACLFPEAPASGLAPACAEAGVIGALPGVVGSMMAAEAIKEMTGAGESLRGRMLIYDALHAENRVMKVRRREHCVVCGAGAAPGG